VSSGLGPAPSLFPSPGRAIGPGHSAGDFLGAPEWEVREARDGFVRIDATVPAHLRNPRGQLFGGFTGVYADLVALFTARAGAPPGVWRGWLATSNMRIDYLRPVAGERVLLEGRVIHRGRRSHLVEVRILDPDGSALVHALVTLLEADRAQ
jgi:uncharacterized protein (TIGR00369 family)